MQGVLTSRNFLYLVEGEPVTRERLTDWELASRLSYFLWSSMPDDALFAAAKTGTLNATNALAGFLTTKSGKVLAFAAYANDVPEGTRATPIMDKALVLIAESN